MAASKKLKDGDRACASVLFFSLNISCKNNKEVEFSVKIKHLFYFASKFKISVKYVYSDVVLSHLTILMMNIHYLLSKERFSKKLFNISTT